MLEEALAVGSEEMAPMDHLSLLDALGVKFDPTLTRRSEEPARARSPRVPGAIEKGSRNNTLASIAGTMRARGATEAEIVEGLRAVNDADVNPPLPDREVSAIARSIASYPASVAYEILRSLNDTGNSARLVARYGHRVRYVADHGHWLLWNGTRWLLDETNQLAELAKATAHAIYEEAAGCANPDMAKAVAKHAGKSLDAARIKAMIELAMSDQAVVVRATELNRHDRLLGVANGVVDLDTGKLREASPEDLITRHSPVAFDPRATCPTFEKFLGRITGERAELVSYFQRLVGYALSGMTCEHVLFFLYGSGANGKSTFLRIIEELAGPELSRQVPFDSLVVKKNGRVNSNDIARLDGARIAIASEAEDGSVLSESLIKQLTGGDTVTARFLYGEYFDFVPQFKLFIAGNHKPIIRGCDDGIWRRLHLLPFDVTIPREERDQELLAKLRLELAGILNWALAGYREWTPIGLSPPACVVESVTEYRNDMDLMGEWIKEKCCTGETLSMAASDAYISYKNWAFANGVQAMSQPAFGRKLGDRFVRRKTNRGNVYEGIQLDVVPTGYPMIQRAKVDLGGEP